MFNKHLNVNGRMWLTVTMRDLWVTLMMSDFVSVYSTKFISYFNVMLLSGRCHVLCYVCCHCNLDCFALSLC